MTAKTNAPHAEPPPAAQPLQSDRAPDGSSAANKFRSLVGYKTRTWSEGFGDVEVELRPDLMNSLGIVHGGVYVTLMDAAFGHAVAWCGVPGNVRSAVTVSLNATFLAVAKSGPLIARGRVERIEGRLAVITGEVVDGDGTVCAVGQGSFMYLSGSENPDGTPRKQ